MSKSLLIQLTERLASREADTRLRKLELPNLEQMIDLASNDYLGLSKEIRLESTLAHGSTGSRLLSGNSALHTEFENWLAKFHHCESALLFNSGYDANLGLISSLLTRHDTIIYDKFAHASIIDGARLSMARSFSFDHNNIDDSENKLSLARGQVVVVVESVYSMDGDLAPLQELVSLSKEKGFYLVVDEAHATGVFGNQGQGLVQELGLENHVFARTHTFSKALGCHGAVVVGSDLLKQTLINFARSFIYSTALPPSVIELAQHAYHLSIEASNHRKKLHELCSYFDAAIGELNWEITPSSSPIKGLIIRDTSNRAALQNAVNLLREKGVLAYPVRAPTVPSDQERIRIVLHSFNTTLEIDQLIETLKEVL